MSEEYDSVHRMAAESLASGSGMTIEEALEGIAFQGRAHDVLDAVEETLGAASGDEWFDWSTGRVDFVKVVWSATELAAAQERANEQLKALGHVPWSTGRDVSANSIMIEVPDDLTAEQLNTVEAAVCAAGVAVQVRTADDPRSQGPRARYAAVEGKPRMKTVDKCQQHI